jgi:hypothetical protein
MRALLAALAGSACMAAIAATAALQVGSDVRIRAAGLGDRWLDGKVVRSPAGCLMVNLTKAASSGYASVSLGGVQSLQLRSGGAWQDVDVKPIHATEPDDCKGDND